MDLIEFYNRCETISSTPYDRVSDVTKQILQSNSFVFDTHCHIFPRTTMDLNYVLLRLPEVIGEIAGKDADNKYENARKNICKYLWAIRLVTNFSSLLTSLSSEDANAIRNNCILLGSGPENLMSEGITVAVMDQKLVLGEAEMSINEISVEGSQLSAENIQSIIEINNYISRLELDDEEAVEGLGDGVKKTLKMLRLFALVLRILSFTKVEDVYKFYKSKFLLSNSRTLRNYKHTIIVAPMMDLEKGWGDIYVERSFGEAVDEYLEIIQREPILPFFAIHPEREDLLDQFIKAFVPVKGEDGKSKPTFFGVKVYPSLGYDPSDYRLMPIYKVCAEKNIPVMTHCGGNIVHSFKSKLTTKPVDLKNSDIASGVFSFTKKSYNEPTNESLSEKLNHPIMWKNVLEAFGDKFFLNLAHFGGPNYWDTDRNVLANDRVKTIIEFMEKYDGVYSDFSFNMAKGEKVLNNYFKIIVNEPEVRNKSLYGTDFWVVTPIASLRKEQNTFTKRFQDYIEILAIDNPLKFLGLPSRKVSS